MGRLWRAAASVLLLAGCGGNGGLNEADRTAAVYEAVIAAVVDRVEPVVEGGTERVVYALPDGPESIPAEVQVEVVNGLKDAADLRFADEWDEAVDPEREGEPVRDGGLLLILGPVAPDGSPTEVRVQVCRRGDDRQEMRVTVEDGPNGWVVSSVTPVTPVA